MFWITSLFSLLHLQGQFICWCIGGQEDNTIFTDAVKFLLEGKFITINPSSTKSYLTTCYLEKLMRSSKEAETKVKRLKLSHGVSFGGATRCTQRSRGWYMRISKCNYACKLLCLLQFCDEEIHFPNHLLTSIWSQRNLLSLVEVWSAALVQRSNPAGCFPINPWMVNLEFLIITTLSTLQLLAVRGRSSFF
jgi:hypothetical protein